MNSTGSSVKRPARVAGFLILLLAAGAGTLAGCTGNPAGESFEPEPLDLSLMLENTSDFQRDLIEDGVVTPAEYEQALLARRDCVLAAGATPGDIYENDRGDATFDYEVTAATEAELRPIEQRAEACIPEYFRDVADVWAYQQLLSPEERDELRPQLVGCLDGAGVTGLNENATMEEITAAIDADDDLSNAERACVMEFNGVFATWQNTPHDHGH